MGQKAEKETEDVDGGKKKKEEVLPVVIFKVDVHCEGCASKIRRCVRGFQGVEGVTVDKATSQLKVTGNVDPWMLRDHLEVKTHKKVEIISPVKPPKKEIDSGDKKPAASAGGDSKDQKKSKELVASTVVLQIRLHCHGCIQRIKKTILKVKGVQEVSVDEQKDLVTVKGTMDVNSLLAYLKDKLKRSVEIVSAKNGGGDKKEKVGDEKKNKKEEGGGDGGKKEEGAGGEKKKKEKEGGGGGGEKKEEGGGGEKKKEKEGGGGEKKHGGGGGGKKKEEGSGGGEKEEVAKLVAAGAMATPMAVEMNKMDYYNSYGYNMDMVHAPQFFSDENPNACLIM